MYTVCTVCIGNLRTLRNPAKEAWGLASVATSLNASHSNYRFPTSRSAIDHPASQLAYTRLAALHAHTQSHERAESHIHIHIHIRTRVYEYMCIYTHIYIYICTHKIPARIHRRKTLCRHRHTRAHPCTIPHRTTLHTAADHTVRRHTHTTTHTHTHGVHRKKGGTVVGVN